MTKTEIANHAGETISIFKLFIHRANVGTHKSPIVCESVSHVNRLIDYAKQEREKYFKEHGYDYDGEITADYTEDKAPKVSEGDWLETKLGNFVYVFKVNSIYYLGYVLREKKLPKIISERVRVRSFNAADLLADGFIKANLGQ